MTVALIGLHVVGQTDNHPEFLWGTFEHKMNSPATPDNTFTPSPTRKDPKSYTLYKGNTPFSQVNNAVAPPVLMLDAASQKLAPAVWPKSRIESPLPMNGAVAKYAPVRAVPRLRRE